MIRNPIAPRIPPMVGDRGFSARRNLMPVVGTGQWSEHGEQVSWLLSHGSSLVCLGPEQNAMVASSNYDYRFKCLPHGQNAKRLWSISLSGKEGGATGKIKSLDGTITYDSFVIPTMFADIPSHTTRIVSFVVDNSDDSVDGNGHSEFGIRIAMDSTSPDDARMTSMICTELPAVPVVPTIDQLRSNEPIYDDSGVGHVGSAAVQRAVKYAETDARRAVLFCCAKHPGWPTFSGSYIDVFDEPVPVLARRRYNTDGAGNRTIKVWVLANGSGNVRITAASGDSVVIPVSTAGTYDWHVADLQVDAENPPTLGTDGGLRSATHDTIRAEMQTAGLITVRVVMGGEVD